MPTRAECQTQKNSQGPVMRSIPAFKQKYRHQIQISVIQVTGSKPGTLFQKLSLKRHCWQREEIFVLFEHRHIYVSANTGKHCWYKQSVVVVVVVVYKNKNELESSPVDLKPHMLVRRITASCWGSLILKIWATLRGTRMSLILKI